MSQYHERLHQILLEIEQLKRAEYNGESRFRTLVDAEMVYAAVTHDKATSPIDINVALASLKFARLISKAQRGELCLDSGLDLLVYVYLLVQRVQASGVPGTTDSGLMLEASGVLQELSGRYHDDDPLVMTQPDDDIRYPVGTPVYYQGDQVPGETFIIKGHTRGPAGRLYDIGFASINAIRYPAVPENQLSLRQPVDGEGGGHEACAQAHIN